MDGKIGVVSIKVYPGDRWIELPADAFPEEGVRWADMPDYLKHFVPAGSHVSDMRITFKNWLPSKR